ncbi:ATP-binding protein [Chitinimonas viridis]|uniref:ATP-binding protein n=1 Tax=Chitinimonas viridis TaxID=664880 RepID=A0ABT8B1H1_9NEIS|nr:ATP-binding protein [Chitinimonas viridis]MDN3576107.1 ATP-binding protein [Chitinimonas viridis]
MIQYARCFPAQFSQLHPLQDWLTQSCRALGLAQQEALRAQLVVEELFANTVHHGYRPDTPAEQALVWLEITRRADEVEICYLDAAQPYNPLLQDAHTVEHGQVGGVGCLLVKSLPSRCHYVWREGRNVVALNFKCWPGT